MLTKIDKIALLVAAPFVIFTQIFRILIAIRFWPLIIWWLLLGEPFATIITMSLNFGTISSIIFVIIVIHKIIKGDKREVKE